MKISYIETVEEKDDNEKGIEKTTEKDSKVDKLGLSWAKLSYQLVHSCSLIKFYRILLINKK